MSKYKDCLFCKWYNPKEHWLTALGKCRLHNKVFGLMDKTDIECRDFTRGQFYKRMRTADKRRRKIKEKDIPF